MSHCLLPTGALLHPSFWLKACRILQYSAEWSEVNLRKVCERVTSSGKGNESISPVNWPAWRQELASPGRLASASKSQQSNTRVCNKTGETGKDWTPVKSVTFYGHFRHCILTAGLMKDKVHFCQKMMAAILFDHIEYGSFWEYGEQLNLDWTFPIPGTVSFKVLGIEPPPLMNSCFSAWSMHMSCLPGY